MATVYLAEDIKHDRKVALKVLKPELAAVVGAERFLAEIKTTAKLQHPHILPLHDSGEADSFLFYVMPFVEGETLWDRIDREKQLPVDEAVRIASTVASARCTLTRSFTGRSMAGLRLERSGPRRDLFTSVPSRTRTRADGLYPRMEELSRFGHTAGGNCFTGTGPTNWSPSR